MKVSINLSQYYSNVDLKSIPPLKMVERVGLQLGAVEEVVDWSQKYEGVVVVKVVNREPHPNADRLHVCMVDDGGKTKHVKRNADGLVQVVCGAPNVRAGMLAAWIPPGAVVPSTYSTADPFILDARELRGVVSNGMLASSKELGIAEDHSGILEIKPEEIAADKAQAEPKVRVGDPLVKYFGLDDYVIDCENKMFTHRPDCFGNLGVARELAGINHLAFKSPEWYLNKPSFEHKSSISLNIKNSITDLVPRFMAVAMSDVKIGPSPVWLQSALSRVGLKPINNVVDITNYVMHVTGQPMHAFDLDKLNSKQLGPRRAKKGEKLALLNGKEVELTEEDIVIATDQKAVALAGIMGGSETEVDSNTKNIVIECATFDMYAIRRTSMRHGIFTDASTRFTKGQSPLQNDRALSYALKNLRDLAGATQASNVYDLHSKIDEPSSVTVSANFVNQRLGSSLSLKDMAKLLENVEFKIMSVPADKTRLHVKPPFWRTDIEIPEDVVEEVGRLYGYDRLPVELPLRRSIPPMRNEILDFKHQLRQKLSAAGANEVLTYSFVHGDLLAKMGIDPDKTAYHIRNAISPDLQYYRTSLVPSLLEKVQPNLKSDMVRSDNNEFAIFEIGKAHIKGQLDEENLPQEAEHLAFVFAADDKTAAANYSGAAYYQAKHYLDYLTDGQLSFEAFDSNHLPLTAAFEPKRSALIKLAGETIGVVGEMKAGVRKALKLPAYCSAFEVDIKALMKLPPAAYQPLGQFPKVEQDVTFEVSQSITYNEVESAIKDALEQAGLEYGLNATVWPRDIYSPDQKEVRRLTFRIWLSHPARTLTTEETNRLIESIAIELKAKLAAERI